MLKYSLQRIILITKNNNCINLKETIDFKYIDLLGKILIFYVHLNLFMQYLYINTFFYEMKL